MKSLRLFDNNVLSGYKDVLTEDDLKASAFSIVVFYEATATKTKSQKADDEKWQKWQKLLNYHLIHQSLLVPNYSDWQTCAFAMRAMQKKHQVAEKATDLQNDALICQSAISWQNENDAVVIIVTDNVGHFSLIAKYLNDRLSKGKTRVLIESAENYFN